MVNHPQDLSLTRKEQGELLDRLRRIETRLVVLMEHLGVDGFGEKIEEK